ncbi:MAG: RagB/SusD family nutrient uptake outer membrane protein [Muribaculaceae bacterium]|nr:RagB/SusD family nutrient uptake outer membrane protein [Muribaculaceae bacterium]
MRYNNIIISALGLLPFLTAGCTDLEETTYDIIPQDKFYQSKENVLEAFVHPFGHGYWMCRGGMYWFAELSADQYMTVQREEHWYNGGEYFRFHYHTWTIDDYGVNSSWEDAYRGVIQCNSNIADFSRLDPAKLGFTAQELNDFIAQTRVQRAWMYMVLFDLYHNIPVVTDYPSTDLPEQSDPKDTFAFIERELKESMSLLALKSGSDGNGVKQGQWTQGGCAALLARLYMNASWWIDEDMSAEAEKYCQDIIDGKYGYYEIDQRWDAPFDWDNDKCNEIIFGYPSSFGAAHWLYDTEMFWQVAPFQATRYFKFTDWGNCNPKYALQPGLDLEGNEYGFDLGKPVRKFMNYPDDVRLKKYKNIGEGSREGLFLYGYLPYENDNGETEYVKSDNGAYTLYIRDQVGIFRDTPPDNPSPSPSNGTTTPESGMAYGDQNSGWCLIKYPIYPSDDPHKIESDYAMIRLAEIYYYLAEIKFNQGKAGEAARLLNHVRRRYYPEGSPSLYPEDGSQLTRQEIIDEWGREFIGEGMRRQTLCRFGVFNTGIWWDKEPDADDHTKWLPLSRSVLGANPKLRQNPGYPGI